MKKQQIDVVRRIQFNGAPIGLYLTVSYNDYGKEFEVTNLNMLYDFVFMVDRNGKYHFKNITPDIRRAIDEFIASEPLSNYVKDVHNFDYDENRNPKYSVLC